MTKHPVILLLALGLAATLSLRTQTDALRAQRLALEDPPPAWAQAPSGDPASIEPDTTGPDSTGVIYRNPRVYNVEFTFEMTLDEVTIDRREDLKVWFPIPREWDSQKNVQVLSVVPEPHARYDDPEYGNRVYFWDLGKYPERSSYQIRVAFRLESYEIEAVVDTARIEPYDTTSEWYRFYTKSGHTINITPEIKELALQAVGDERNPYLKAQRVHEFVREHMRYQVTMGRGVDFLFTTAAVDDETGEPYYEGACGQYSALFIALARAVGIPARSVQGYVGWAPWLNRSNSQMFSPQDTMVTEEGFAGAQHHGLGPHVWAEFYLPGYGWIPADPTWGVFGSRPNWKIIMSKGRDVPLGPEAPQMHHAGYGFQWVPIFQGKGDLFESPVWNIGKIRKARVDVYHTLDPYPADALANYLQQAPSIADSDAELEEWKTNTLEDIDYFTRDYQDRDVEAFRLFEGNPWPNLYLAQVYDAFVFHMLRKLVGDEGFYRLAAEYQDQRTRASQPIPTSHFVEMAKELYGAPLAWFFEQWKPENGLPHLRLDNVRREKRGETWLVSGSLVQEGRAPFRMPVPVAVETDRGREELHTIWLADASTDFELESSAVPIILRVDPDRDLLILRRMPQRLSKFWNAYPNISVFYGTLSEEGANREAAEWYTTRYLHMNADKVKPDTAATRQDLETEVVVLFGRPSTNTLSGRFSDHFNIRFDGETFSYNGVSYTEPSQGVAQVVGHPLRARGRLILFAGLSEGAMSALRDLGIYDAPHSYVVFDGDTTVATGDREGDSDLIWKFE